HTLRYVVGDSVFFPALKRLATDSNTTYTHTASTEDVQRLFSNAAGRDLTPLFHLYLYTTNKLEVSVRLQDTTHWQVKMVKFRMPLAMEIRTGGETVTKVLDRKGVVVTSAVMPLVDPKVFYLKKVIYE